ncbi:MAG: ABC transporter permease, partial [Anaerolineae bacterium]|nr:ABC transporter permease [Anaerolineae bacterium]
MSLATSRTDGANAGRQAWIDRGERFGLVIAWAAVIIAFGILRPDTFLSWANLSTILGSQAVLVVVTLGLIIPLTAGDYDLSIASVLTLSAMLVAVLNVWVGVPIMGAILLALLAGLLVGFLNGFFVIYFRIHSLIVTLGMGTFIHGLTLWFSDTQTISGVSMSLVRAVIITRVLGIPLAFYYALLLAIVIWYVFSYTAIGQRLLFVGR